MSDTCPYCGAEVEINHDDGYGLDESETFSQTCGTCDKTFVYTTSISVDHDLEKADCLNGSDHQFELTVTYPPQFARLRCKTCGETKPQPAPSPRQEADAKPLPHSPKI